MSSYSEANASDSRCCLPAAATAILHRLPRGSMLFFVAGVATSFAFVLVTYVHRWLEQIGAGPGIRLLIYFKAAVEVWGSLYAAYFVFISIHYLFFRRKQQSPRSAPVSDSCRHNLAIIYLCCDDLEERCLESLVRTHVPGSVAIYLHDDSDAADEQDRVDRCAEAIRHTCGVAVTVLRRGTREGGKPGALNYVMERIPDQYTWILICDNDSFAPDPDWFLRICPMLNDDQLACVQFRNTGPENTREGGIASGLNQSIDVFEVFLAPSERFGWMPFLGHNAVLRQSAIREVGGFTPGEFADDIDLSVRLNLAGYEIKYNPSVVFQETHPANYHAFRARSYKWAYGCGSVLRRWGLKVLTSSSFRAEQKFFFFMFIGFYYTQILLLTYLLVSYIMLPLLTSYGFSPLYSVLFGSMIVVLLFLPTLAYFAVHRRMREWPRLAAAVGMVYGSIDFVSTKAVFDCVLHRKRMWVPTNTVKSQALIPSSAWLESLTGFALLAVPFVMLPHLLYLPCSYLFALKFLVIPVLYLVYIPHRSGKEEVV